MFGAVEPRIALNFVEPDPKHHLPCAQVGLQNSWFKGDCEPCARQTCGYHDSEQGRGVEGDSPAVEESIERRMAQGLPCALAWQVLHRDWLPSYGRTTNAHRLPQRDGRGSRQGCSSIVARTRGGDARANTPHFQLLLVQCYVALARCAGQGTCAHRRAFAICCYVDSSKE